MVAANGYALCHMFQGYCVLTRATQMKGTRFAQIDSIEVGRGSILKPFDQSGDDWETKKVFYSRH